LRLSRSSLDIRREKRSALGFRQSAGLRFPHPLHLRDGKATAAFCLAPAHGPARFGDFGATTLAGDKEPIALTPTIQLALCWLTIEGLTEPWQVEQFWQNLTSPMEATRFRDAYCRSHDICIPLNSWVAKAREKGALPKL
jgi:hypothetical protein